MWKQQKDPHQTLNASALILDFPASRAERNKFPLFMNYPVSVIFLGAEAA
jgi:hypothetical protein